MREVGMRKRRRVGFCAALRLRRRSREALPRWLPPEVVRAVIAELEHRER